MLSIYQVIPKKQKDTLTALRWRFPDSLTREFLSSRKMY